LIEEGTDRPSPASIRLRRLVRHWGLPFLIAIGFLLMALLIRETDRTVPAQSLGLPVAAVVAT
jgi:hypothetical protein